MLAFRKRPAPGTGEPHSRRVWANGPPCGEARRRGGSAEVTYETCNPGVKFLANVGLDRAGAIRDR